MAGEPPSSGIRRLRDEVIRAVQAEGGGVIDPNFRVDDACCKRYLARFPGSDAARKHLIATVNWRRAEKIHEIFTDSRLESAKTASRSGSLFVAAGVRDSAGRPIMVNIVRNHEAGDPTGEKHAVIYHMERACAEADCAGADGLWTILVHCGGAGWSNLPGIERDVLQHIVLEHYSHRFAKVFIINSTTFVWLFLRACRSAAELPCQVIDRLQEVHETHEDLLAWVTGTTPDCMVRCFKSRFDVESYFSEWAMPRTAGVDCPQSEPPRPAVEEPMPSPRDPYDCEEDHAGELLQKVLGAGCEDRTFTVDLETCRTYLQHHNNDVAEAEKALKATLEWRSRHNLDVLVANGQAYQAVKDMSHGGKLFVASKHYSLRPVLVGRLRQHSPRPNNEAAEMNNVTYHLEKARRFGRQAVLVLDFSAADMQGANKPDEKLCAKLLELWQLHYPGFFHKILLVDAPPDLKFCVDSIRWAWEGDADVLKFLSISCDDRELRATGALTEDFKPEQYFAEANPFAQTVPVPTPKGEDTWLPELKTKLQELHTVQGLHNVNHHDFTSGKQAAELSVQLKNIKGVFEGLAFPDGMLERISASFGIETDVYNIHDGDFHQGTLYLYHVRVRKVRCEVEIIGRAAGSSISTTGFLLMASSSSPSGLEYLKGLANLVNKMRVEEVVRGLMLLEEMKGSMLLEETRSTNTGSTVRSRKGSFSARVAAAAKWFLPRPRHGPALADPGAVGRV